MDFTSYSDDPVGLATEIVNSIGWVSGNEQLNGVTDLEELIAASAGIWRDDLPAATVADLEAVRFLRERLRRVFTASEADEAADEINRLLADHGALPALSTHGHAPHMHFEPVDGSLVDWLAVITAMGLATVIADHGLERLGICGAPGCRDVYVDTSRNLSRRHCSDTCRNRENVAAHRLRQRSRD